MKQLISKSLVISLMVCSIGNYANASDRLPIITEKLTIKSGPGNDFKFFNAHRQGRGITISWVADNMQSFEVQYSFDGIFFDPMDEVMPGNSGRNNYHIPDAFPGYHFFRIKGKKFDGSEVFSDVASLRIVQRK